MTTDEDDGPKLDRLNENLAKIEALTERLVEAMSQKRQINPALQGPGQDLAMKAMSAYVAEMMSNPAKIFEQQVGYWGKSLKHYMQAQQELAKGSLAPPKDETPRDKRFANPLWETHPFFNFIKQQYFLNVETMDTSIGNLENLDPLDRKRLEYFSHQFADMMSPTNFLGTNPDALAKAVETDGQSLVDGLENLVRDIEENQGNLLVTLSDRNAFAVGNNIAASEGGVVFRNRMFELIQYAPKTEKVHKIPLVIFPPWINKFYILDLKPQNSLIKWAVEQGFTVFVVSWKNPEASYRDVGMDTYVEEGYLTAINEVKSITGENKVNAVGYCIGGTTLALTLALLEKRKDKSVRSATFFTTMTDFADPGEMSVFLTDDFVDGIEKDVTERGILESFFMSRTFSFLRSNDLIYTPAIKSYMMGEAPPAFDLLFWNGDSTNLPARMAVEYLRWLCQENRFAGSGFSLLGENLTLKDVKVPLCAIACETDHIAAWKGSYAGIRQMGAKEKTFILAEAGHIAGIINPPSKKKYGHYTCESWPAEADDWIEAAEFTEGSWWPQWGAWLAKKSGAMIPARGDLGGQSHPVLSKAPGDYVQPRFGI